jgi:hypothetical protein
MEPSRTGRLTPAYMMRNTGHRVLFFLVLLAVWGGGCSAFGESRIYRELVRGMEYVNTYRIQENGSGFIVTIVSRLGEQIRIQKKLWLDHTYATMKWSYQDLLENIDIFAVREGDTIRLTGMDRGEQVEKVYKIDSLPWKQQFPLDLERFATSSEDSIEFWAIGTNGPADMRIAKFMARKEKSDPIQYNGERTDALQVRVSFAGILSVIWHGVSWHRVSDGRFVLFDSSAAPGHPPTKVELVSELD